MLNLKGNIQDCLNKYGGLFTGITIDRGCGTEYFAITDTDVDDKGNTCLILEDTETIGAEFLDTCDYIKFHFTDELVVRDEPIYNIPFKEREIKEFISLLKGLTKVTDNTLKASLQKLIDKLNI